MSTKTKVNWPAGSKSIIYQEPGTVVLIQRLRFVTPQRSLKEFVTIFMTRV